MATYVSKENDLGPDAKIRYIWGLKGSIFYFVKRSWSALTSYIHIKCYHFMKYSHLLWHFGTLTMRSVFRNALVNGYIS